MTHAQEEAYKVQVRNHCKKVEEKEPLSVVITDVDVFYIYATVMYHLGDNWHDIRVPIERPQE